MKVTFEAMKGHMGGRDYYSLNVPLSTLTNLFTMTAEEIPPEHRHQRALNKTRVPGIQRYIRENEEGYLFSSIVGSYQEKAKFEPYETGGTTGKLTLDLAKNKFIINDGQHRTAGIAAALRENPDLGEDTISVLLFPFENAERMRQMFADLNRAVVKTSKTLNVLFDQRDELAKVTLGMIEQVPAFKGLVDMERMSLPAKSGNLFTLLSLYDSTGLYINPIQARMKEPLLFQDKLKRSVEFWNYISGLFPDWKAVAERKAVASDVRTGTISTHSIVLNAIGAIGGEVQALFPDDWEKRLAGLAKIDWRKSAEQWANVVIVAGSVITNRQSRIRTRELLWRMLDLPEKLMPVQAGVPIPISTPSVGELPHEKVQPKKRGRPKAMVA